MMTSLERRELAIKAIGSVIAGGKAGDFETQYVDFKEEVGSRTKGGVVVTIGPRNEIAASTLAKEAACMANTDSGGVLVVGVEDTGSGPNALIGAQSEADWLKERIYALTKPGLVVEVEELLESGKRLLLINVPDVIQEVMYNNKLQTRVVTDCRELTGEDARRFLEARRNFDWSAQRSGMKLSDCIPEAISAGHSRYQMTKGAGAGSDLELVKRLEVTCDDSNDPELTRSGALLFCEFEPGVEQMSLIVTNSEGMPSRFSERGPSPLLPLFDKIMQLLLKEAFPSRQELVGIQRRELRAIPELALRESLVNALMHRDYRIPSAVIVALATGSPSDVFKVVSPGGLLPGLSVANLIATPSRLRNTNLAEALRKLGLAEREGIGIDTIYREMLREGHPAPEITEQSGSLIVRLAGGTPDTSVLHFFTELGLKDRDLPGDVRVIMAADFLLTSPSIRPEDLAVVAQCSRQEAIQVLENLERVAVVERLLNGSLTFRFSDSSKAQLASRIQYQTRSSLDEHIELVLSYLDGKPDIGREEVKNVLNVGATRASVVLKQMVTHEILDYVGPRAGRNVRYKKR